MVAPSEHPPDVSAAARESSRSATAFSDQLRPFCSLVLSIHLILVFLALSGNYAPSALQQRLLEVFAFYTRMLNLEPNYTPYYLTHASELDVDHRVEVLLEGRDASEADDWVLVPDPAALPVSESFQRKQRFAKLVALFAEDDAVAGRLAKGIATQFARQRDLHPVRVRSRAHMLQHWTEVRSGPSGQPDPYDASYFQDRYDARILIGPSGSIDVLKTAGAGEVAQPRSDTP